MVLNAGAPCVNRLFSFGIASDLTLPPGIDPLRTGAGLSRDRIMKRKKQYEEQIIAILKEHEAGVKRVQLLLICDKPVARGHHRGVVGVVAIASIVDIAG